MLATGLYFARMHTFVWHHIIDHIVNAGERELAKAVDTPPDSAGVEASPEVRVQFGAIRVIRSVQAAQASHDIDCSVANTVSKQLKGGCGR